MDIIILGAGQVGGTLAENLAREDNDITLVDAREAPLRELQDRLDIRTVVGAASYPNILRQAGAENADMIIAVTNSDETNLIACEVAYHLFHTPTKIARIRSPRYLEEREKLFGPERIPVDVFISPEQIVTDHVKRLIEYPGALQVLDFADGKVRLVAIRSYFGGPLVGRTLAELRKIMPNFQGRIAAIYRGNRSVVLTESTVIEIGDEVFVVAAAVHIREVISALRRLDSAYSRVIIAGGGNIGERLALSLENTYLVKLIEHDRDRSHYLADALQNTTVLVGDASDRDLLIEENIEYTDVFCAVTDDDEVNIMSCMQAKRLGARQVMALITRPAYVDLIEGGNVDIAISPQQATIGSILTHIRRGDIVNVHSLRRGAAEAIEVIAHGDRKTSRVVGRKLSDIKLPKDSTIGAIVRGEKVIMIHRDTVIEPDDHIILFLTNKKYIPEVERLFQVNIAFF
jgi:trk system potassium uptake protein